MPLPIISENNLYRDKALRLPQVDYAEKVKRAGEQIRSWRAQARQEEKLKNEEVQQRRQEYLDLATYNLNDKILHEEAQNAMVEKMERFEEELTDKYQEYSDNFTKDLPVEILAELKNEKEKLLTWQEKMAQSSTILSEAYREILKDGENGTYNYDYYKEQLNKFINGEPVDSALKAREINTDNYFTGDAKAMATFVDKPSWQTDTEQGENVITTTTTETRNKIENLTDEQISNRIRSNVRDNLILRESVTKDYLWEKAQDILKSYQKYIDITKRLSRQNDVKDVKDVEGLIEKVGREKILRIFSENGYIPLQVDEGELLDWATKNKKYREPYEIGRTKGFRTGRSQTTSKSKKEKEKDPDETKPSPGGKAADGTTYTFRNEDDYWDFSGSGRKGEGPIPYQSAPSTFIVASGEYKNQKGTAKEAFKDAEIVGVVRMSPESIGKPEDKEKAEMDDSLFPEYVHEEDQDGDDPLVKKQMYAVISIPKIEEDNSFDLSQYKGIALQLDTSKQIDKTNRDIIYVPYEEVRPLIQGKYTLIDEVPENTMVTDNKGPEIIKQIKW